jgi:mannose-6-phosphate isomerase-like protein (cupin superfamily)
VSLVAPRSRVLSAEELRRFASELSRSPERWRGLDELAQDGARRYAETWSDDHVNAWTIRWSEDADTGFHDHDGAAAAIVVVEGHVVEERLTLAGPPVSRRFGPGQCFHLPSCAIHRVRHGGGAPALTVHAYSPPLRVQGVYRVGADGALERETVSYTEELRAESRAVAA